LNSRGMALVQVLLLSALLMIMLLSAQHQARSQLKTAEDVKGHSELQLKLQSVEAELLFLLSSREWSELVIPGAGIDGFNFHGEWFSFAGASVKVQDQAGLLSVNSPNSSAFSEFTLSLLGDAQIGQRLAAELTDWRDADDSRSVDGAEQADYSAVRVRNYGLQTLDEVQYIKSMTPELYKALKPYLTVFRQGENLMNMPESLVASRFSGAKLAQILLSRKKGELNDGVLVALGEDASDENNVLRFGRTLQITFTVENANVKLTRSFIMSIDPSRPAPFELLEYRMRDTEMEIPR
jgi:general secretion pathway protein K